MQGRVAIVNATAIVEVDGFAICNRCGSQMVAWVQSKKGKWYLAEANIDSARGGIVAQRFNFHSKHCGETR